MLAAGAYNYSLWINGKQADTKSLVITKCDMGLLVKLH
jgi:hypothetical protein